MWVTVMTDASYCPDTGAAGYGYWIASNRGKHGGGGPLRKLLGSSTTAETLAVANALHIAFKLKLADRNDSVLVQTDCVAVITLFQGGRRPIDRTEQAAYLHVMRLVDKFHFNLRFKHVKGHNAREGSARSVANHMCDSRARHYMKQVRQRERSLGTQTLH